MLRAFLHLKPVCEGIDDTGELRNPDDPIARKVADMDGSRDRGHMVLAAGFKRDVAQDHEVVVSAQLLEGPSVHVGRLLVVALEPLLVGAHDPLRGVEEALAARRLSGPANQGSYRLFRRLTAWVGRVEVLDVKAVERPVNGKSPVCASSWIGWRRSQKGSGPSPTRPRRR